MWGKAFRSRWFAAVVGATVAAVIAGGSAVLADHQSDGLIHGCVKTRTGALRVVNSPSECDPKNETAIEWNRQGRDGQDGAPGLPGNLALAGQQCPAGQVVSGFDNDGNLVCTSSGAGDVDADNDGFTVGRGDCNDRNTTVYPGAEERPDGHDNDCDGSIDEDLPPNCHDGNPYTNDFYDAASGSCIHEPITGADFDGDGHEAREVGGPDCDDNNPSVNPDQTEIYGDALDNDCDGFADGSEALNETDELEEADFCRLESPSEMTVVMNGTSPGVFGVVDEWPLTNPSDPLPDIRAQVGYGPQGSDPRSTPGWRFTGAEFTGHVAGGAEYMATIVAPTSPGTYSYVYRFSFDDGLSHTYCDLDGAGSYPDADFDPAVLGTMTVVP